MTLDQQARQADQERRTGELQAVLALGGGADKRGAQVGALEQGLAESRNPLNKGDGSESECPGGAGRMAAKGSNKHLLRKLLKVRNKPETRERETSSKRQTSAAGF